MDVNGKSYYNRSAFDTLKHSILCNKLVIYGLDSKSLKWINSFLSNRLQMVKIGQASSKKIPPKSGVPQGGILFPLLCIHSNSEQKTLYYQKVKKLCKCQGFKEGSREPLYLKIELRYSTFGKY
jgi:hypothetical protein